jgi:hypothetical protein
MVRPDLHRRHRLAVAPGFVGAGAETTLDNLMLED